MKNRSVDETIKQTGSSKSLVIKGQCGVRRINGTAERRTAR